MLKACLNGNRDRADHPAVPLSAAELGRDAAAAVAAGAAAVHVHPRGANLAESLDPADCAAVVDTLRRAVPGTPVGLTTGAWIEPDIDRRLDLVRNWTHLPDFVSVNFSEEGAVRVCELAISLGMGVEAGISSLADARRLAASGLADRCLRLLVEVEDNGPGAAVESASRIDAALAAADPPRSILHHGMGVATWAVLAAAADLGRDGRIGLEDTLVMADGSPARDNAHLVTAAMALMRRGAAAGSPG